MIEIKEKKEEEVKPFPKVEPMEWFNEYQQNRKSTLNEDNINVTTQYPKERKIPIKEIILVTATSLSVAFLLNAGRKSLIDYYHQYLGAKTIYQQLEAEKNLPFGLKIMNIDEKSSWCVKYQASDGTNIERADINIKEFTKDILSSAIDNGADTLEVAAGLSYAGLSDAMIEVTTGISKDELRTFKLENYVQMKEENKESRSKK